MKAKVSKRPIRAAVKNRVYAVDRTAVGLMYHALLAISFVEELPSPMLAMGRMRAIANEAILRMNTDHTKAVQKALGIEGIDKWKERKR